MNRKIISAHQLLYLMILNYIGLTILIGPAYYATVAGRDGYLAMAVGLVGALLVAFLYIGLMRRYPGQGLLHMMERIIGRWMAKPLMLVLIAVFPLFITVYVVRSFGEFVKWALLPNTPETLIMALFTFCIWTVSRYGLVTAASAAQLLFWPFMVFALLMLALLIPESEPTHLMPIAENGFGPIFKASGLALVFPFTEAFIFLTLVPYVKEPQKLPRVFIICIVVTGLLLLTMTAVSVMVLGVELVSISPFPAYLMAKKINLANFFERLEVIMFVIWYVTIFFRAAILFLISCLGIAETLRLPTHKAIATPLAICVVGLSMIIIHSPYDFLRTANIWMIVAAICTIALPLGLLLLDAVKKLWKQQAAGQLHEP